MLPLEKMNYQSEFVKLEEYIMWEELGISGGTAIIVLIALYFVVKWAVKNGIVEAYEKIKGREVKDDLDEFFEKGAEKKG
jgi:hypothetical protein